MIAGKPNEYCKFHPYHVHSTSDFKALHYEVIKLLKRGHLKELFSEKGRYTYGLVGGRRDRRDISKTPSPPPVKKTVRVILWRITNHRRILLSNEKEHTKGNPLDTRLTPEDLLKDYAISFHENEPTILCRP